MSSLRVFLLSCLLTLTMTGSALAEGFAMTEWSARGLGLAGGMVGRADDPSAIAYNAAGITQLPGTQIMGGASFVAPYGTIEGTNARNGQPFSTSVKTDVWVPPHAYITHQLNDDVWLGFGVFSRFGLGNSYKGSWVGKYNVYDVGLQTVSAVPTVAYKINDMFSVSAGLEIMYLTMYEGVKSPALNLSTRQQFDNDMQLEGQGVGFGAHFGLHARFNEQWSAGLAYKTQVTQNVHGDAQFSTQYRNMPAPFTSLNAMQNADIGGTVQLPDSLALGIAYKPLPNLSFEVGTVWTRWSTYNHLNIYFDEPSGLRALNEKNWKDGWNFNASVEYSPLDWLTLRAGYWHETSVIDEKFSDFMMPTNGRDVASLGLGFKWEDWKLDLAYAHIWIYPTDYSYSQTSGIKGVVRDGHSTNTGADIYSFSISYTF